MDQQAGRARAATAPAATATGMDADTARRRITAAGIWLGLGLGGLIDGIVAHQILQWHHMLTDTGDHPMTTVAGLEANTLADGLFHASAYVMVLIGLWLLASVLQNRTRRVPWSSQAFVGLLLMGWGIFNLVEGTVNHMLLGIHHVRDDVSNKLPWDLGFLALSIVLIAVGWWLQRRGWSSATADTTNTAA